ncbi:MAG TPA: TetR/AcrR family transcriptional regulator [Streptosporangiaceae bacterium]|nr:TetR/AcrR family transcriptional regulator [Streptosporangiaceae bacterium]
MSTIGGTPIPGPGAAERQPERMRADARRNRARLLDAAIAAFTEHGADDASLDEIARRAGVGIGTLYRHFPTRQALLEAVYRDQVEALCAKARGAGDSAAPGAALTGWLHAMLEFGATKRNLAVAIMSESPDAKHGEMMTSCSTMVREAAASLLEPAQRAGEIRADIDAADLLKLSHAIAVAAERPSPQPGTADRLLTLMLEGLRANGAQAAGGPSEGAPAGGAYAKETEAAEGQPTGPPPVDH